MHVCNDVRRLQVANHSTAGARDINSIPTATPPPQPNATLLLHCQNSYSAQANNSYNLKGLGLELHSEQGIPRSVI